MYSLNAEDSCSIVPAAAVALTNAQGVTASVASGATLAGGLGYITLSKPSSGTVGTIDVGLNLGATGTPQDDSCNGTHGGTAAEPALAAVPLARDAVIQMRG